MPDCAFPPSINTGEVGIVGGGERKSKTIESLLSCWKNHKKRKKEKKKKKFLFRKKQSFASRQTMCTRHFVVWSVFISFMVFLHKK
jgi:hypothetical protein